MSAWTSRRALLAGVALVLVVNAVALVGVAWNRQGEPESMLHLSQRELQSPGWNRFAAENNGIGLRLLWRVADGGGHHASRGALYGYLSGSPEWLDDARMAALGFDLPVPGEPAGMRGRYEKQLTRDVLYVLELDGQARQTALVQARKAAAHADAVLALDPANESSVRDAQRLHEALVDEDKVSSRLFVVDVGLDAVALRSRYPDRRRHAIVHGRLAPEFFEENGVGHLHGRIAGIYIDEIHVPLAFRAVLEPGVWGGRNGRPEYAFEADVAFGRRLEPWLVAVAAVDGAAQH